MTANSVFDYIADDKTEVYDRTTDSLQAIRDNGVSDIIHAIPLIPNSIDLANTATVRMGFMVTNMIDDLPSGAEITPSVISVERKAIGGTSWSLILDEVACSELAGMIYYDEVFDSGTGYAEGDSIRITFKGQKVAVNSVDYELTDGAFGAIFQTYIRETMVGTDSASTHSALDVWHVPGANVVTTSTIGLQLKTNVDAELTDHTLAAAAYFDPAADTVATVTSVTNAVTLPTIPSNWITTAGINDGAFTAAKFAAASLNGKGDWSTHKTTNIVTSDAITTNSGSVDTVLNVSNAVTLPTIPAN